MCCSYRGDKTLATAENKWFSSRKRPWKAFSIPDLVFHVEVRLHMLVVELHRGHGAVFVVVLLLIPELPAESLRRAAQASAHYSEYLPREANSCEPAGTCRCASYHSNATGGWISPCENQLEKWDLNRHL